MAESATPMMSQYFEIKKEYEDCILFFRLGDFYEMFYDDAVIASQILEITLTGKNCGKSERAPMCGVPYHSAQNYIAKLIKSGRKVAICEQTEDPKTAKGIVKRDVIRVITPGTATLDTVLQSSENNFLASIYVDKDMYAASFCDVSTGELITTEGTNTITENNLANTIACFKPSEIIINDKSFKRNKLFADLKNRIGFYENYISEDYFDFYETENTVFNKFTDPETKTVLGGRTLCIRTIGAMLKYLKETQKINLSHIREVRFYNAYDYMEIDMSSRRNLELTQTMRNMTKHGSLFGILDKTKTGMGSRRLKMWMDRPLISADEINKRLDAVEEMSVKTEIRGELTSAFKEINDIERILGKVVYSTCNARELAALRKSIGVFPQIHKTLSLCENPLFKDCCRDFDILDDIYKLLDSSIKDDDLPVTVREGGMIKSGFDKELDRLRSLMDDSTAVLMKMEAEEKEKTGIKNLKISYNKVFGYYIDVTKSQADKVPENYIRKQTLANSERYITPELKELENSILSAKERVKDLEYEDFMYVLGIINKNSERLQNMSKMISIADVLCALAAVSVRNNYTRPVVDNSDIIDIKGGRHPIVELSSRDSLFVPNDTFLNTTDSKFSIITGPNMAGKSTYMRQTALITIMAQIGSFVPASKCRIGVVDKIFTRIGASDDLSSGYSTFMVEMNEVAHILKNATSKSLVILDEVGRGTSTFDGLSIAWAVVEYICANIGAKSLFATHYHELIELENRIDGVKNYSIAVKRRGDDIIFLRKIINKGTDDSFGIEVARLAGVPDAVIERAKEILTDVEDGQGISVERLPEHTAKKNENSIEVDSEILENIMSLDISTLTPLEAMNELYRLQKKVSELNEN